jgi:hypothetical protein
MIKTITGKSLAKVFRLTANRVRWMEKVYSNGKSLGRLSSVVALAPRWDTPSKEGNVLKLQYIGNGKSANSAASDMARIQKVLNCTFDDNFVADTKLGRMKVQITLNVPWKNAA